MIRPFARERLREEFRNAKPFPFVLIEEFLEPDFARKVAEECPSFEQAQELGFEFNFVNEERKVQISNSALFPEHVAQLNAALAAPEFLADLSYITSIPDLIADPDLAGTSSGWRRSFSSCVGFSISARIPPASEFLVVSCPAVKVIR